ncbi:MAG: polysaccharide deacetylase family protein [Clostridia bacterium]|nr:polysaccharide deacetylase family protein [Clostridia bacterium]
MQKERTKKKPSVRINVVTNLVLGALVLSVGALCIAPDDLATSANNETRIYRNGSEHSQGVSLMFNVYWGTEEVYKILDILGRYQAKATFFIGGSWADDNVECLRKIYAEGHELGNHGYFHKDHAKLSQIQNQKEISSCNRFIELSVGESPVLFAPPSGSYGNDMLAACQTLGMKTVLWSKDTIDWRDKNAALIYTRATKNVKSGDLILMHPMQATVDALEDIIRYYQTQKLALLSVSENIAAEEKG